MMSFTHIPAILFSDLDSPVREFKKNAHYRMCINKTPLLRMYTKQLRKVHFNLPSHMMMASIHIEKLNALIIF